jgi:hypothetical protein
VWTVRTHPVTFRTRPRLTALAGATALAAALALGGCGGSDAPPRNDAAKQSAAAKPSAAAVAPLVLPAQGKLRTTQGAAIFANYWWQVVDRAYQQMDVAGLRAFALPACATCVRLIDGTERDRSVGATYAGGQISMRGVRTVAVNNTGIWLRTTVAQKPLKIADSKGKVVRAAPGQTTQFVLGLVWTKAGWRVAAMEVEK